MVADPLHSAGAGPANLPGPIRVGLLVLSGFLLHLAYPAADWDLLAWVALVPLLLIALDRPPGRAFLEGWLAGLAFFLPLLRWLTYPMTTYSTLPLPLALLVLLGLSGYLALYWGGVAWALAWLARWVGPRVLWAAPALWVTAELGRTHLLTGFPWGLLGYSQYRRLALIQVAAWTGVYGVSFLVALVNAALAWAIVRGRRGAVVAVVVIGLAVGGVALLGAQRLSGAPPPSLPVVIAQGNIDQAVKWDKVYQAKTLEIYRVLTTAAQGRARLIVWPETAVPAYVRSEPWVLAWLTDLAEAVETPLLVGAPDAERVGQGVTYFNSAFLMTPRGVAGRYDKIHLVPFGEYVPLKGLLFFVHAIAAEIGDFSSGRRVTVFPLDGASFGAVICYEVIFPDLFRRFVGEGARFMVNITNDAWFGRSGGPLQHLAMVPFRAVETGVAVVRAANTGVSAVVGPTGRIGPTLGLFERGAILTAIPLREGETFYTRFGDLFAYGCALGGLGLLGAGLWERIRSRRA